MCTAQSITQTMMDPKQFCESGRLHTGPHNRNPLSEGQRGMTGEGKVAQQINEIAIQLRTLPSGPSTNIYQRAERKERRQQTNGRQKHFQKVL